MPASKPQRPQKVPASAKLEPPAAEALSFLRTYYNSTNTSELIAKALMAHADQLRNVEVPPAPVRPQPESNTDLAKVARAINNLSDKLDSAMVLTRDQYRVQASRLNVLSQLMNGPDLTALEFSKAPKL